MAGRHSILISALHPAVLIPRQQPSCPLTLSSFLSKEDPLSQDMYIIHFGLLRKNYEEKYKVFLGWKVKSLLFLQFISK